MFRRKDFTSATNPPAPAAYQYTNRAPATSGGRPSEFGFPSSKRIKTEPHSEENWSSIDYRLAEIKNKYSNRRESSRPLGELNDENFRNMNYLKIKEVDSPISTLQRSILRDNYFSAQEGKFKNYTPTNPEYSSKPKDESRSDNIDRINQKIRSILKTIENSEQEPSYYNKYEYPVRPNTPSNRVDSKVQGSLSEMDLKVPPLDTRGRTAINSVRGQPQQSNQTRPDWSTAGHYSTESSYRRHAGNPSSGLSQLRYSIIKNNVPQASEAVASRQSTAQQSFEESIVLTKPLRDSQEYRPKALEEVARLYKPRRSKTQANDTEVSVNFESSRSENNSREETQRLYRSLRRQVQLDETYRNKKYAYKQIREDCKLERLAAEVGKLLGKPISKELLREQMVSTEQEYNPFYTCREDKDYSSIAEAYIEAHQHWSQHVMGRFSFSKLTAQGFSQKTVDLQKKGYLVVEDLVRLLNLQAETFVRNRDLVLIHRRLGGCRLLFSALMKQLCRES